MRCLRWQRPAPAPLTAPGIPPTADPETLSSALQAYPEAAAAIVELLWSAASHPSRTVRQEAYLALAAYPIQLLQVPAAPSTPSTPTFTPHPHPPALPPLGFCTP